MEYFAKAFAIRYDPAESGAMSHATAAFQLISLAHRSSGQLASAVRVDSPPAHRHNRQQVQQE
jgi:hypothetical protein